MKFFAWFLVLVSIIFFVLGISLYFNYFKKINNKILNFYLNRAKIKADYSKNKDYILKTIGIEYFSFGVISIILFTILYISNYTISNKTNSILFFTSIVIVIIDIVFTNKRLAQINMK